MEQLLIRYGILAVFFGSMVEGDAMPVVAGLGAHHGYFTLWEALAASIVGMFLGDCVWYWIGRRFGAKIEKTNLYRRHLSKGMSFVDKVGVWQILFARAVYGTRNATMMYWGLRKLNFAVFAAIDVTGCFLWGLILVPLGYLSSISAAAIIGDIRGIEIGVLLIIVIIVVMIVLKKFVVNQRLGGKHNV